MTSRQRKERANENKETQEERGEYRGEGGRKRKEGAIQRLSVGRCTTQKSASALDSGCRCSECRQSAALAPGSEWVSSAVYLPWPIVADAVVRRVVGRSCGRTAWLESEAAVARVDRKQWSAQLLRERARASVAGPHLRITGGCVVRLQWRCDGSRATTSQC